MRRGEPHTLHMVGKGDQGMVLGHSIEWRAVRTQKYPGERGGLEFKQGTLRQKKDKKKVRGTGMSSTIDAGKRKCSVSERATFLPDIGELQGVATTSSPWRQEYLKVTQQLFSLLRDIWALGKQTLPSWGWMSGSQKMQGRRNIKGQREIKEDKGLDTMTMWAPQKW